MSELEQTKEEEQIHYWDYETTALLCPNCDETVTQKYEIKEVVCHKCKLRFLTKSEP